MEEIIKVYEKLHSMPELGMEEKETANYLAQSLEEKGFKVYRNAGNSTGVVGVFKGEEPGPVVALRADMDALPFTIDGNLKVIHACGHDANCTMVLMAALEAAQRGIGRGSLKIVFQPAEETLQGAKLILNSGFVDDVEEMYGIHLRPIQEAKLGEATPALCHGSAYVIKAQIKGKAAHGARPHLGINVIDAAANIVHAINAIRVNPVVPHSIKTTKLAAGGEAFNIIPDTAHLVFDLRAQSNQLMELLIEKTVNAVQNGAASIGAEAEVEILGGVPGADYHHELVENAQKAIQQVLGKSLGPVLTPGGEDFHFYARQGKIKTAYIGLGADLEPGLHHQDMSFNLEALNHGVEILNTLIKDRLG
ncbi:MAG: amidohydrolase [Bacillota bacterium]